MFPARALIFGAKLPKVCARIVTPSNNVRSFKQCTKFVSLCPRSYMQVNYGASIQLVSPSYVSIGGRRSFSSIQRPKQAVVVPAPEPSLGTPVFIEAFYVGRGIDIIRVHGSLYTAYQHDLQLKSVTITLDEHKHQYLTAFNYGSIVMFNVPPEEQDKHLKLISQVAILPIAPTQQYTESFKVIIHENLEKPSTLKAAHLNVRQLDSKNVSIVSIVMAQTVALDYYAAMVDRMIGTFTKMNMTIQETGNFDSLNTKELYKLVASNNTVFTNVLSKLGFFEGADIVWDYAEYNETWEHLREDFDLDERYNDLSLKLNIIKDDARFFLEVLHHRKSTRMEWMIIFLIAGEMAVGVLGLVMSYHQNL